jgi:hypothetical protein
MIVKGVAAAIYKGDGKLFALAQDAFANSVVRAVVVMFAKSYFARIGVQVLNSERIAAFGIGSDGLHAVILNEHEVGSAFLRTGTAVPTPAGGDCHRTDADHNQNYNRD